MAQTSPTLHLPVQVNADAILDRVRGAVTFKRSTIAGIAADRRATLEAAIVVLVVGIATAIGYQHNVLEAVTDAFVGWGLLTAVIWYVADRFMATPTSREAFTPLLRAVGFALAPAALNIIHFIWGLGPMVAGFGTLWSFLATIVAVQVTTRFGWARAIALTIAGGIAVNVIGFLLGVTIGIDPQIW